MEKKFLIHPSIFLVKKVIVFSFYVIIVTCWIIPYLFQGSLSIYRVELLRFALSMSVTIILGVYFLKILFFELANTTYILSADRIIKRSPRKTKTLLFSEIISFRYSKLPIGLGIIRTSAKKIYLPLFVENLFECIQSIEEILIRDGKQSTMNENEISRFKLNARISDFTLRQTYTVITPLFYIIFSFLFLSSITTIFIWRLPLLFSLFWIIFSLLFPCIGHLSATLIITQKISTQLKQNIHIQPVCDTVRVYSITALVTGILYLICGIVYKNLFCYV